jgi:hypothetical protein
MIFMINHFYALWYHRFFLTLFSGFYNIRSSLLQGGGSRVSLECYVQSERARTLMLYLYRISSWTINYACLYLAMFWGETQSRSQPHCVSTMITFSTYSSWQSKFLTTPFHQSMPTYVFQLLHCLPLPNYLPEILNNRVILRVAHD